MVKIKISYKLFYEYASMNMLDSTFEMRFSKCVSHNTQNEFAKIAKALYGDKFQSPHSLKNGGDHGADGIVSSDGMYFQVFSPESIQDKKAIKKIEEDRRRFG